MNEPITLHPTDDELVPGWRVATVIVGTAITLPAFLVGAEILTTLGVSEGAAAILLGGIILAFIASAAMFVAVRTRCTTYQLLDSAFGTSASRIVSFMVAITLLGWFGITAALFGQSLAVSIQEVLGLALPQWLCTVAGCGLMTATTLHGFAALEKLSKLAVPVMLFILLYAVLKVVDGASLPAIMQAGPVAGASPMGFGAAVSVIVGSFMVGVAILPDIARFIRAPRQVAGASFGSFGSFFPLVLVVAGLPGVLGGEKDLVLAMTATGLGLPALIMMVLASWTTNVSNLYSSSLGFAQAFPSLGRRTIVIGAGLLGLMVSLAGIRDYFVDFLIFLGVLIPPIAGVYIVHVLARAEGTRRAFSPLAFLAWAMGAGAAFLTSSGVFTLTGIPALDSLGVATVVYWLAIKGRVSMLRLQP
ncbi:cytosine permease [Kordiimonas gwangyangensis]|uniref:cytosine permease n=1 Tax=Kordiimonas gwangyangensis TaxID=288022 RepID=UPI0003675446|nr:cytosine permease [Kordiimonas gwangyangensis]